MVISALWSLQVICESFGGIFHRENKNYNGSIVLVRTENTLNVLE